MPICCALSSGFLIVKLEMGQSYMQVKAGSSTIFMTN